jgi:hypothetical protein
MNGKPVDNYTYKRKIRNAAGVTLSGFVKHVRMELNKAEYGVSRFASSTGLQVRHLRGLDNRDGRLAHDVKVTKDCPILFRR